MKFKDKVIVITGAAAGLGKQNAIRFAKEGTKVAICDIQEEKLKETAKLCEAEGAEVLALVTNLKEQEQMKLFVQKIQEKFGHVDVLINGATSSNYMVPFLDQTIEDLEHSLKTQLFATWTMMQLCHPLMKENGGSIINFISNAVQGLDGYASYTAAKGAVGALTKTVAKEWGKYNIRVNNVSPIAITDTVINDSPKELYDVIMTEVAKSSPFNRVGIPEDDVVPVILFLASEDSRWITGQDIRVEGGVDIHW
ncbi:SDR family NAD(P)-dependent oxidoreductase [Paenibacillus sinopodophylli]|uniref:SDR family NAD(P)-dependent oxidoreductase n=1 Tax=Paenibacillus sinopodophylli TaxID=1837342 RepID=UPI00110D1FA0|nr:SDR family oxidoreductase [Paenibacillus sinopodophylli]